MRKNAQLLTLNPSISIVAFSNSFGVRLVHSKQPSQHPEKQGSL